MLLVPFTGISYAANKHDPPKAHKNTTAPLKLYKDTSNIQPRSFDANAIIPITRVLARHRGGKIYGNGYGSIYLDG
jgi:hypothetical protein